MDNEQSETLKGLDGIKILALSRVLAGPFCTMLLADIGAEVIKLEIPDRVMIAEAFPLLRKAKALILSISIEIKRVSFQI